MESLQCSECSFCFSIYLVLSSNAILSHQHFHDLVVVIVCLFIIFGCGLHKDDYEQAQHGKRKSGGRNDIESVRRFRTPEELGLRGSGRVVGVGKSD